MVSFCKLGVNDHVWYDDIVILLSQTKNAAFFLIFSEGLLDKIGDELRFCIDILEYIIARTSSTFHVSSAIDNMHFRTTNENVSVGSFLKLHCGHNNMFAKHERDKLRSNLTEIIGEDV